jgi:hypothetical protein
MTNLVAVRKIGRKLSTIVGDRNIQRGWNECRGGQWSDKRGTVYEQLRYEAGRYMYTIARCNGPEGNTWAPPRCTSGRKLIETMGYDVVASLYRSALKELNL